MSNDEIPTLAESGDVIDLMTFEQILEMDDDEEERDFSRSIVYNFFEQAEGAFERMKTALEESDLDSLSALGHFMKGNAATIGLIAVKDTFEKIQHFGSRKSADGSEELDDETALQHSREAVQEVQEQYEEAERILRKFYHDE